MTQYEPVIGLEVHAQLLTNTKLFCRCALAFGAPANETTCPVCLGLPGSLPVTNERAVQLAVRAALALECTVNERSVFARKQYFYPDLPKGYQISQLDLPLAERGVLEIEVDGERRRAGITRVHMEEDAGKNVHGVGGLSAVDLNRAGTPLIEIVGDPDLRSSAEAAAYLRALRDILVFLGVNDGNLEEGSFRCDCNVSVRPVGSDRLGTRTELKNINSFRFVQRAIDVEIARQIAILDAGGTIAQETRSFDPDTGKTATLRSKSDAHDYRYFPEPDLPPLVVTAAFIERERAQVAELPEQVRTRWTTELGLAPAAAATLTGHPGYVRFFEQARTLYPDPQKLGNWMLTEVLRGVTVKGIEATFTVSPQQLAELLKLVDKGEISGKQAKEVYAEIEGTERSPAEVVKTKGLKVVSDAATLVPLCEKLVADHKSQADAYRAGKLNLLGFFVGQVMKQTKGSADPQLVSDLLKKLLDEGAG